MSMGSDHDPVSHTVTASSDFKYRPFRGGYELSLIKNAFCRILLASAVYELVQASC